MFERMADIVPPGTNGSSRVEHLVVTEEQAKFQALRAAINPHRGEVPIQPGTLCQLFVNNQLMMSDSKSEHYSNAEVLRRANGDVLIAGLGLGMVLLPICKKPEVRSVLVLENNVDVMSLVATPIRQALGPDTSKLTVVLTDAFQWSLPKDQLWDVLYFDIWPDITTDNLPEMTKLKRKFARRLRRDNPKAWMGAWCERELKRRKRHEDHEQRLYGGYSKMMGKCSYAK